MFSFPWLYLEKKQRYYLLLLVWATQSMFHIVANRNSAPRAVSSLPAWGRWDVWGQAWAAWRVEVAPCPPCLQQSPSIIVADTGRWRWCVLQGAGTPGTGSSLPRSTKVGNYEFYFRVILFTWNLHYTRCECTLYLFVVQGPVAERERREAGFALCRSLTWEELGWWRDAELIFIHSDAIFHHHSIRSLGPTAINNSADMFLICRAATCAALWILEEKNGIINISLLAIPFYNLAARGNYRSTQRRWMVGWWEDFECMNDLV